MVKPRALGVHIFAGGFSIGVERHFDIVAHLERCTLGVRSWRAFRPGVPVYVDKKAEWAGVLETVGEVDLVYGNPPCASWSAASIGTGRRGDALSGDWAADVLRVASAVGAPVAVIESVRGAHSLGADTYRRLADRHGMSLSWLFVNAVDHGLPQDRARLFIVFSKGAPFVPQFAAPARRTSALEALAGAPPDAPANVEKIRHAKGYGVSAADVVACFPLLRPGVALRSMKPDDVRAASPNVARYLETAKWPFGTETPIRCPADDRPVSVVFGQSPKFVHPTEDRLLTLRELMRLQGYPDDFSFAEGSQQKDMLTLGKTVCPPVGAWVAGEVAAHLRGERVVSPAREAEFVCCSGSVKGLGRAPAGRPTGPQTGAQEPPGAQEATTMATPTAEAAHDGAREPMPATGRPARGPEERRRPRACQDWPGMVVKDFWEFAHERQAIWFRRVVEKRPRPWTDDPVMRERFFTNVFRELDPGTAVAREIMAHTDRPAWERLWNLVLYRRFNREETWRKAVGYVQIADAVGSDGALAAAVNAAEDRVKALRAAKEAVFTDAHQLYGLPKVAGADLTERTFNCAYAAADTFPDLAERVMSAGDVRAAFDIMRKDAGAGIGDFLGWQLTLDAALGLDPVVRAPADWAPVTTGAKVGLVLHMNWPRYGIVGNMECMHHGKDRAAKVLVGYGDAATKKRRGDMVRAGEWPLLETPPKRELEAKLLQMVAGQDREFSARGLDFATVAAPGHGRLTPAAVEHSLCEWQKYISIAVGGPSSLRVFDKKTYERGCGYSPIEATAASEPTGGTRETITTADLKPPKLGNRYMVPWTAEQKSPCSVWVFGGDKHWVNEGDACALVKGTKRRLAPDGREVNACVWCLECASMLADARVLEMYSELRRAGRKILMDNGGAVKLPEGEAGEEGEEGEEGEGDDEGFDKYRVGDVIKPARWPVVRKKAAALPASEVRAEWLALPGPTALARTLAAEGAADDRILSATKACCGQWKAAGKPHLFTKTDLARLRARLGKRGAP